MVVMEPCRLKGVAAAVRLALAVTVVTEAQEGRLARRVTHRRGLGAAVEVHPRTILPAVVAAVLGLRVERVPRLF